MGLARVTPIPVATGEVEAGHRRFRELLEKRAAASPNGGASRPWPPALVWQTAVSGLEEIAMTSPQVPIDVDPETGIWRTDGLPMIYLPRHFLVNMQKGIEAAIGPDAYRGILYASSDLSALQWCRAEATTHKLGPAATFRHYLKRLSQRGYGLLEITALDEIAGTASVIVRHSAFALGYGPDAGRHVCYMFEGSIVGGMRYVLEAAGRAGEPVCREVACAANGAAECRFELRCDAVT